MTNYPFPCRLEEEEAKKLKEEAKKLKLLAKREAKAVPVLINNLAPIADATVALDTTTPPAQQGAAAD